MLNSIIFTEKDMVISLGSYSRSRPKVKKEIHLDYPKDSYVNGELLDRVALAHTIATTLKDEKMKGTGLLIGLQHQQINVVEISVPYVKGKISQAVHIKLSERFIGITDGNYISFKINRIDGNMCHGMATIVPHKILNEYYELSVKIGIPLTSIDYMGNILYKSMHVESSEVEKETFMIAEVDMGEVYVHLYHEGIQKSAHNEMGSSVLIHEEPVEDNFVFKNILVFSDEDMEEVISLYKGISLGLQDITSVNSTLEILFHRHKENEENKNETEVIEVALKEISGSLIDLNNMCQSTLDFNESMLKSMQKFFKELMMRLQKLNTEFTKIKNFNASFHENVQNMLTTIKVDASEIISIFARYVLTDMDQKKHERRMLLQRVCKTANHVIARADMSQNYPDISTLYVQGMNLDSNEKNLMAQNLSNYYTINIQNYESEVGDIDLPYIGIFYNDYNHFNDLDLASEMEKNDKVNRTNYDNIILGIGGVMVFGVVSLAGLWGYTLFDTSRLENETIANRQYIDSNKEIDDIVTQEAKLKEDISEIDNFQEYFTLANVDLSIIYEDLQRLSDSVTVSEIAIDDNFQVTQKITASTLENVSAYMEIMTKEGYTGVAYDTVIQRDGNYEVSAHFKYVPKLEK